MKKLSIFKICIGLSIGWHLLGAATIGTVPEPQSGYAQSAVPELIMRRSIEMLSVGFDAETGRQILRPVANFHDPEYFGYPRRWDRRVSRYVHTPSHSEEIAIPAAWESLKELTELPDRPPRLAAAPGHAAEPLSLALDVERARLAAEKAANPVSAVAYSVISGPLAHRKCLVQLMPDLDEARTSHSHNLVLGAARSKQGDNGLVLRIWVSPDGVVRVVSLESSSGDPEKDAAMIRAVKQWVFEGFAGQAGEYQWGRVTVEENPS